MQPDRCWKLTVVVLVPWWWCPLLCAVQPPVFIWFPRCVFACVSDTSDWGAPFPGIPLASPFPSTAYHLYKYTLSSKMPGQGSMLRECVVCNAQLNVACKTCKLEKSQALGVRPVLFVSKPGRKPCSWVLAPRCQLSETSTTCLERMKSLYDKAGYHKTPQDNWVNPHLPQLIPQLEHNWLHQILRMPPCRVNPHQPMLIPSWTTNGLTRPSSTSGP
ncbi:uncharacterized protein LOC125890275 [Epinephelus fuscoguttatus]|uniref:uncharacterized protein LOC125890275 n=1 Tax=Epinephelus fuscoguttatus TaxID=293821 RepID=UPI0020D109CC|nr:uncharacterized protein LOC125890275 [Epinephelus fuscoguttatus]